MKQLRAMLEAVRQLTEGIKSDIKSSIDNHKTIQTDANELNKLVKEL